MLTFDDITRLVTAQRNAAWRDVARRIAHEIKNPLTPIQLSAERLRRKYRKEITRATWRPSTAAPTPSSARSATSAAWSTSSRPSPACRRRKFAELDAAELLRQAVFAQRVAEPGHRASSWTSRRRTSRLVCDGRMIGQALTNVLKNAAEAVAARRAGSPQAARAGSRARLVADERGVAFEVEDNGVGLPAKDRDRLTEPYVTTREKGTGLGLAIVKRILEDHGGELELADAPQRRGRAGDPALPAGGARPARADAQPA